MESAYGREKEIYSLAPELCFVTGCHVLKTAKTVFITYFALLLAECNMKPNYEKFVLLHLNIKLPII